MIKGEIWWADLPVPVGSIPGKRRPVLVLQNYQINRSSIATVIVAAITSNVELARATGNVLLEKKDSNLDRTSVVNLSQLITIDKTWLTENIGMLRRDLIETIDQGVKLILDLK